MKAQRYRSFLLASLLCVAAVSYAEDEQNRGSPDQEEQAWMDRSHDRVIRSADELANWADNFFGNPRSDLESHATSRLRLRPQYEWDEEDGSDWKLRATGRLTLPQVNQRLSLVFFSDDGDSQEEFYNPALASDGNSTLGLQYQVQQEKHSRMDLIAAVKSGLKGKVATRYRYRRPFWERNRFLFSEELFWIGGDGFGTLTRMDIDRKLSDTQLLRWANKAEYSEESNGVEWNSRLAWIKRLNDKSAVRVFSFIRGETDPDLLKSRGFGFAYRREFIRDWLYWEVEPRYAWRKQKTYRERDEVASVKLRIEVLFSSE